MRAPAFLVLFGCASAWAQSCPISDALPSSDLSSGAASGGYQSAAATDGSQDPAMQAMLQQSYGQTAQSTAQQLGVNPTALAEIGQAESGFRNVPTANGSSSATGPWQITSPTFDDISQQYGLGFSPAQQTDPNAQAVEAAYIVRDYANTVTEATGTPATIAQAYGAYVFGPTAGAQMASASPDTPLSAFVSAKALSNNGMSNWTVGQFYSTMSSRLGPNANQPALMGVA
jgi:hypothetical protein